MVQPTQLSCNRGCSSTGLQLFSEWRTDALEKWSSCDAASKTQLLEASHLGSKLRIIETVCKLVQQPEPVSCFEGKDEARALELLEQGISEALAFAPASSELFSKILARRIRCSYDSGELARCSRDCRFARGLRPEDPRSTIELLMLQANCSRAAGCNELAREMLNEAMRRINELAGNDASMKAQILQSCMKMPPKSSSSTSSSSIPRSSSSLPDPPSLLEGRAHDWLNCCSDALALSQTRERGRFLYATRSIKPGSVLIVDRPFSFSTDAAALGTNCANCHMSFRLDDLTQIPCETCSTVRYCSEECRRSAWDRFHKYECRVMGYLVVDNHLKKYNALLTYRTVVTAAFNSQTTLKADSVIVNEEFLQLHEHDDNCIDLTKEQYEPNNYKTVFSLETHCGDRELRDNLEMSICCIFLTKCLIYSLKQLGLELEYNSSSSRKLENILAAGFLHNMQAIMCNAYEIVENVRNEETKILEPRNVGGAIYTSVSLTNHSCYPNIVRHCFPNGVVVVTSLRFIAEGEEILDCYGQHFLESDRDHRRKYLKIKYYFECQCEACLMNWPMKLPATQLNSDEVRYKCEKCSSNKLANTRECIECAAGQQQSRGKRLYNSLQNSIEQKRIVALTKMYDGCYTEALPLLLEHANFIGKILTEPSLEVVKTQQSIIQCLNAMSLVAPLADEKDIKTIKN